jgi:SAM-dependent methyltransferase
VTDSPRYVPAAGRAWLTALYDPTMALTMRERAFRPAVVTAVLARAPRTVVDIGCGTGTLAAMLARADPNLEVHAIDGDETVLGRAREKTAEFSERIHLARGLAGELPVESSSVDVFTASLLLHHLAPAAKRAALTEARRVLRPGGHIVIADWGAPHGALTRAGFLALQLLDGFENTREHAAGRLPSLIEQAGFSGVKVERRWRTVWGSLELISASAMSET